LYDPVARSPAPTFLVDRANTFEIAGRIDAKGHEVLRLDETAIRAALDTIRANGIEAIAVCFLFSHVNSVHERRCRELIHDVLPEIDICLSHEIDQQPREYERTVSVCLEAWLRPMMTRAMSALSKGLRQRGFRGRLFYADGSASLIEEDAARARVSHLITGGPSAAARCAEVAARIVGAPTAISLDIGSMSADIALIDHGVLQICRNTPMPVFLFGSTWWMLRASISAAAVK
jgi:N-methylhydantoinase A